jgi:hypothetical protein
MINQNTDGFTAAGAPTPADQRHKQAILDAGIVALRRIKGDSTWNDWMAVGEAYLEISNEAQRLAGTSQPMGPSYKKIFSERWAAFERQASNERPITKQERWALRVVMENRAEIEAWRMQLKDHERRRANYPGAVITKWKAYVRAQQRAAERANEQSANPDSAALAKAKAEPEIDVATFSKSAVQRMEAWQRQRIREMTQILDEAIEAERKKARDEIHRWAEEEYLPLIRKQQDVAKRAMNARKEVIDKTTFNKIRVPLQTDHLQFLKDLIPQDKFEALIKEHQEGFVAFNALEKYLLKEKDSPTTFPTMPATWAEWEARHRPAAKRAAKQAGRQQPAVR